MADGSAMPTLRDALAAARAPALKETGAPVRSGSVKTTYGGILAAVHVRNLKKLSDSLQGRQKAHVLSAIACMQALSAKNKRLGAMVGARMKRGLLDGRGIDLSGKPGDIAETIAELAGEQPVTIYRLLARKTLRVRVVAGAGRPPANARLIGTYDENADYRHVVQDVAALLRGEL